MHTDHRPSSPTLTQPIDPTGLLSYSAAAAYLSLPVGTVYALVNQKRIPHIRLSGRLVRFVPSHAFQPQEFSFSFPGADLKFRGRKSVRAAPRIVRRFALPIEDLCALRDSPTFPNSFLLPDVSVEITL